MFLLILGGKNRYSNLMEMVKECIVIIVLRVRDSSGKPGARLS
jgi:hypothetical protein